MKKKYLTTTIFIVLILISGIFFFWLKNNQKQTNSVATAPVITQSAKTPLNLPALPPATSLTPAEKIASIQQTEQDIINFIEDDPSLSYMADEYISSIADSYLQELSVFNQNDFLNIFLNDQALSFAQEEINTYQSQNIQIENISIEHSGLTAINDGYQQTILVETKESQNGQTSCKHETMKLHYFFNSQVSIWQIDQIEILNSKITDCLYL